MEDIFSVVAKIGATLYEIRSTFSLTQEELAKICSGCKKEELADRIFDLVMAAGAWRHCALECNAKTLHEPVLSDGQSLFDVLCESKIDTERILFVGKKLSFK